MDVTLVVVGGKTNTSEVKLSLPTTVGRAQECHLKLPHPLVSRRHCELFERDGKLFVRDLGSMNGTYVGSERISETELPREGLLTVGAVTFRALYDSPVEVLPDDATQHDFGTETKSDVQVDQSVELVEPTGLAESNDFEQLEAPHNALTQPAPPADGGGDLTVDHLQPPVAGKRSEDAVQPD